MQDPMASDSEDFKKVLKDVTAPYDKDTDEVQCHQKICKFLQIIHTTATNTDKKIPQNVSQMLLCSDLLQA